MSTPLLSVENLTVQFQTDRGIVRAVDGISFEIHEGEIVGLVGESGAGKTVASMSLVNLVEGDIVAGEVRYRGETIVSAESGNALSEATLRERIRGNEIAVIFQDPMETLNPVFTVGDQIAEIVALNRDLSSGEAKELTLETLREVGIPDPEGRYDEYPHQFSGGMRQRALIAMALACEPSLIIADEPTTALDVTVEGQILELVATIQERYETSVLWVTHDLGVVAELCDRVNVMYVGEIVEQAPVEELFYETSHPYTTALLNSMPRPDRTVAKLEPIRGTVPEPIELPAGCRFHPRCPDARAVCRQENPELRAVGGGVSSGRGNKTEPETLAHRSACFKHDGFEVGYGESPRLEVESESERAFNFGLGSDTTQTGGEHDE